MNCTRTLLQFACLIACWTLATADVANAQNVQQYNVTNSQTITGNGAWGSSRLNAHDRIAVQAPVIDLTLNPALKKDNGAQWGICRAIINNGAYDVFVPWKTPVEWTAFLNAVTAPVNKAPPLTSVIVSECCTPQIATVCGTPTNIALGYRSLGAVMDSYDPAVAKPKDTTIAAGTLSNWGAANDIYGPINAAQVLGNAQTNYQVTYVCDQGNWVKTREIGSCTPLNGACNSPGYMLALPGDLTTLCGQGSIFAKLKTISTGWTWTCQGTPGMSDALCQAYNNPPIDGQCGPINNPGVKGPRYDATQIAAVTPDQLCFSGTFVGPLNNGGGTDNHWKWSCDGQYGGNNSGTCYALSAVINGACGSDNGKKFTKSGQTPKNLCQETEDTPSTPVFDPSTNTWSWTCAGFGPGATTASCKATFVPGFVNGSCGPDNGGFFPAGTLSSSDPNLCSNGTVGTFSGSSSNNPYWKWTCVGANGGSTSKCSAFNVPKVDAACGSDNNGYFPSGLFSSDPNLCATGTIKSFSGSTSFSPYFYHWTCNGSGGGQSYNCYAYNTATKVDGQCGPAKGVASLNPPSSGLCNQGIWTSVSQNGNGSQWIWDCQGSGGGGTANCSAPVQQPFANGVCGTANGTAIPNTPNFNLCSAGVAGTIAGAGPWTWNCLGTGGGSNSPQCMAYLCQACTGTTSRTQATPRSGTIGSCNISGTASWTEVDALLAGAANQKTITWNDPLGGFVNTVIPTSAAWPNFCPPCYMQAQSVNNATVTVTQVTGGGCTYKVGDKLPVSSVKVQ